MKIVFCFVFHTLVATPLETTLSSKVVSSTSSPLKPSATSTSTIKATDTHTATQKSTIDDSMTEAHEYERKPCSD